MLKTGMSGTRIHPMHDAELLNKAESLKKGAVEDKHLKGSEFYRSPLGVIDFLVGRRELCCAS
jgi:hypothetical protein